MTADSTAPRSSRSTVPSPSVLGLSHPRAAEDLARLGWQEERHIPVLWDLAAAGDQNLALNNLIRLVEALNAAEKNGKLPDTAVESEVASIRNARADTLIDTIETQRDFRLRLFALFGASSLLGDHIVAHPHTWAELAKPLPTRAEMMDAMLGCVDAEHVSGAGELIYKAAITGPEADTALRRTYRLLLARIAAIDVASTTIVRGEKVAETLPFTTVSQTLADAADAALTAALAVACRSAYRDEQPDKLAVIAMGKCGAQELNYISDVDVIFVGDNQGSRITLWAGEFVNIGTRVFFEVDAGLRPEGKNGMLVRTLDSHVSYYRRWAKTWEFQALLKARPMTGDMELGEEYIAQLNPMVWKAAEREDFVPDVQAMRRRVVDNVPAEVRGRELKLGTGGLRDVEFAVQLLQMVHGRTDETLRVRSTVAALRALVDGGYIGREDGQHLVEDYEFLRLLEHRLQLQRLKRTHTLPPEDDAAARVWLGKTSGRQPQNGWGFRETLERDVRAVARQIEQMHAKLFYRPLLSSVVSIDADAVRLSPDAAKRQLAALGYENPKRAYEHLRALVDGTTRKHKLQTIILPSLLEWLSSTVDPDAGLLAYRRLSEKAEDRSWFLRLLRDENIVGKRLMFLLGTSPYLAELYLNSLDSITLLSDGAKGPKLMDKDPAVVTNALVAAAGRQRDPDKAISVARGLRRAELARVAAADLLGLMSVEEVCQSLSLVWNAVLEAALQAEIRAWEDEHACNAPAHIAVIGMGRLGGSELGYGSDADVLFVMEPVDDAAEAEDALPWATTICENVRRRLGQPTQDPPLDVDVDLRPEGRNGAVVRTLESYRRYYAEWGETWEYQALLRATWIAGNKDLGIKFLHMIDEFRYPAGGVDAKTVREVRRMKARVDSERLPRGADKNTHTKLGRGALSDVEWTVQLLIMQNSGGDSPIRSTSTLEALRELAGAEMIREADAATMREAWITATKARNAIVLVRGKRKDQLPRSGKPLAQVAAAAGWEKENSQAFLDHYLKKTRRARWVVDRMFWGEDIVNEYASGDLGDFEDGFGGGPRIKNGRAVGADPSASPAPAPRLQQRAGRADQRDEIARDVRASSSRRRSHYPRWN